jgi:hypothetical protein
MKNDLCFTNVSFNFLSGSSEFVNLIMNNISSCILLLDKDVRLTAFNDSLKTIFSNRKDEDLIYKKCGEAIGCAYQIEEQKSCGDTSQCNNCELRVAALASYLNDESIFKDHIVKPFFDYNNKKVDKHIQFSTRVFNFNGDKYVIMIIDDISRFVGKKPAGNNKLK